MNNHILIVDDDKSHGLMLETLLKKWQFKISRAENGLEAVEKIKETPMIAYSWISVCRTWTASRL